MQKGGCREGRGGCGGRRGRGVRPPSLVFLEGFWNTTLKSLQALHLEDALSSSAQRFESKVPARFSPFSALRSSLSARAKAKYGKGLLSLD